MDLLVLVAQQIRAGKHFTGQPLVASAFIDSTPQVGVLLSLRNRAYALANGWLSCDAAEVCFERVLGNSSCDVLMPLIYASGVQSFLEFGYVVMPLVPPDGACEIERLHGEWLASSWGFVVS